MGLLFAEPCFLFSALFRRWPLQRGFDSRTREWLKRDIDRTRIRNRSPRPKLCCTLLPASALGGSLPTVPLPIDKSIAFPCFLLESASSPCSFQFAAWPLCSFFLARFHSRQLLHATDVLQKLPSFFSSSRQLARWPLPLSATFCLPLPFVLACSWKKDLNVTSFTFSMKVS